MDHLFNMGLHGQREKPQFGMKKSFDSNSKNLMLCNYLYWRPLVGKWPREFNVIKQWAKAMKNLIPLIIVTLMVFGVGPIACSDNEVYEIPAPKNHATYMISRQGELSQERFDTVFVFGHVNNESVAEEITAYLNEDEPGKPFRYRRFHPDDDVKGP